MRQTFYAYGSILVKKVKGGYYYVSEYRFKKWGCCC